MKTRAKMPSILFTALRRPPQAASLKYLHINLIRTSILSLFPSSSYETGTYINYYFYTGPAPEPAAALLADPPATPMHDRETDSKTRSISGAHRVKPLRQKA